MGRCAGLDYSDRSRGFAGALRYQPRRPEGSKLSGRWYRGVDPERMVRVSWGQKRSGRVTGQHRPRLRDADRSEESELDVDALWRVRLGGFCQLSPSSL